MKRNIQTPDTLNQRRTRQVRRLYFSAALTAALCAALAVPAFAADNDPLTIVNNLSDFIFSCIKAIGVMVLIIAVMLSLIQLAFNKRANN